MDIEGQLDAIKADDCRAALAKFLAQFITPAFGAMPTEGSSQLHQTQPTMMSAYRPYATIV